MDTYDVRRFALILAEYAEIEGMKAKNKERELRGEPLAYDEKAFSLKAERLKNLAYEHNQQTFGL